MTHDKNIFENPPGRRVGALALPRDPDGNVLLVEKIYQKDEGNPRPWGMVGGSALADETPRDALRREFENETGLNIVQPGRLLVFDYVRAGRFPEGYNYVYDTPVLPADTKITLPAGELSDYKFVPPGELNQYMSEHGVRRALAVLKALDQGTFFELEYGYPVG
ncbi:NUDIX domain-containing protein [Streptomyces niveus]|uniref:NUDIX domain-containing protein n=1 Tax=Streptomyces niveus TaxID=193462 RepID=UPI00367D0D8B